MARLQSPADGDVQMILRVRGVRTGKTSYFCASRLRSREQLTAVFSLATCFAHDQQTPEPNGLQTIPTAGGNPGNCFPQPHTCA
jgi:hypothetical protein